MKYENIELEIGEDFVARVTLNRTEQLNTFNTPMALELQEVLNELDSNTSVRVILIKGSGKAFCAGIDLKEFHNQTPMQYREWIETMERPLSTITRMNKPVLVQVHGVAAANGAGLVAAADLAIGSQDARIGLTAINVGLNCVGPVVPVSKCVGRKQALEMLFYGELLGAQQAMDMGLFNKIVPSEELEQEAEKWATKLAQKSPLAVENAKKSFYTAADMEYQQAVQYMNEAFSRLCTTEDAQEGISAFMEKRQPQWKKK